jgi:beta-galactosidase
MTDSGSCGCAASGWKAVARPRKLDWAVSEKQKLFRSASLISYMYLSSTTKIALLILITAASVSARTTYNFNSDWRLLVDDPQGAETVSFADASWKSVTLPRPWNEDEAFRKDIKDLSTGIAWYRKTFRLPDDARSKKVFIEFEGVRFAGEVYLNGKFLGRHENGITAFGFDLTEHLVPGENLIAVRTDNSWDYKEKATGSAFQWNDKNFNANYGGINKGVRLHMADRLYQTLPLYTNLQTTGTYVYAKDIDVGRRTATLTAESQVRNEFNEPKPFAYEVVVQDLNGKIVKTIKGQNYTLQPNETKIVSASDKLTNLNFWSWGYGYLYTVTTNLRVNGQVLDSVKTRTGFRKTEFGNGLFKLNDRTLMLKGYAQRTSNEWPALGNAVPPWLSDFSNRLMVESNANLVRWMHVTPWKQDVESCDRVGLMQAMPAGDAERDVEGRRWEQRKEVMRDAIIYNRNNPSIIFYESGNESVSEPHMQQMKDIRDKYDPHGGRAIGSREMLDSRIAEYGGEMLYINKSAKHPMWATEYSRDEGLRKYWDEFSPPYHKDGDGPLYRNAPANDYNRNQDSHAIENVRRWFDYWEARPGTGKRVSSGGVNIIFSDTNTHYRGAENYRRSGEVDAMRIPKDGFYAHQVMWDGWVDAERPRTHVIGHWNYAPGVKKNIYVVSNTEKVELFINGKSKGFGEQSSRFLFTFKKIGWEPGEIKAIGYSGKVIAIDSVKTAGEPFAVKLTPRTGPNGLTADGADVAMFDVEVVDKDGSRCPTALNMINFTLTGEAEWRGGIAQGPENYILSKSLPVEGGINRAIIRSTTNAGKVQLTASSDGLNGSSVSLDSKPTVNLNGLSTFFPSDGLPVNLDRGPTPAGESYRPTRRPLEAANVTAGSNTDKARSTTDDNELSDWTSDGKRENAWIRYDLARPEKIDQVVLKLVGWRTQMYPLKISVDDKVVFTGTTPRSLGYVTINFSPATGKSIKIELAGEATNRDALGNIIEITGAPDPNSAANRGGATKLGIVEAEFYQAH